MTPEQFINTWTANDLTERAGAQSFIEDLCSLLQLDKPRSSEDFCYEKGVIKDSGKQGWADVWKRDYFGWENKKPGRDLCAALTQLRKYSGNLGNPPLLIVCDRDRIEIHTAFRGYPDEPRTILLQDIGDLNNQQILRWVFTDPDKLKPLKFNAAIISEATGQFSLIANAAFQLNQLRNNWLNPPEWVDWVITPEEQTAGFPKRPVAKSGHEAELKKRTLTNLYNANLPGSAMLIKPSITRLPAHTVGMITPRTCPMQKYCNAC